MSEKPESEEFDEGEEPEPGQAEDLDVDRVMKDLDLAKRRGQKLGEPAWRRLERLLEEKRTADLVSDFEDYDVGSGGSRAPAGEPGDDAAGGRSAKKKGKRR
jgi:hypothetical protein